MASRISLAAALAVLVVLGLLLPVASVQSRVRSHKRVAESRSQRRAFMTHKVQQLQQVLRLRMPQLRRAIWDELGLAPRQPLTEELADAARELLAREADFLSAEDSFAAALLHDYAQSNLVPVLFFDPFAEPEPATYFTPENMVFPHHLQENPVAFKRVETVESSVQMNREGQVVRTVRRCSGNRCVTTEEVQPEREEMLDKEALAEDVMKVAEQPEARELLIDAEEAVNAVEEKADRDEVPSGAQDLQDFDGASASAADTVGTAIRVAARSAAKELKNVMEDTGFPPLSDIFDKLMNSSFSKGVVVKNISSGEDVPQGETIISGNGGDLAKALNDSFGKAFKNLLSGFADGNLSSIEDAMGSTLTGAETLSVVRTVENGTLVCRVSRCKARNCTTTTEDCKDSAQGDFDKLMGAMAPDAAQDSAQEGSNNLMGILAPDAAASTSSSTDDNMVVLNISGHGDSIGQAIRDGFGKAVKGLIAKATPENLAKISHKIGSAFAGARTVSSVRTVENGTVVCRVSRCEGGECTTAVEDCEAESALSSRGDEEVNYDNEVSDDEEASDDKLASAYKEVVFNASGSGETLGEAMRDGFGQAVKGFVSKITPEGLSKIGNAIGSVFGGAGASSVTSWTSMEDGNVVCHVRRCSEGRCTTAVEECKDPAKLPSDDLGF